jgi:hypothetical protein
MDIRYTCTHWGQEDVLLPIFLARVLGERYDGIEINLPESDEFVHDFMCGLETIQGVHEGFTFVAQQVLQPVHETASEYLRRMKTRLEFLVSLKPDFINSHTGKDYYSFDDNCRIIEAAESIASRAGIPILHETHRARFTFHASSLISYIEKFPDLKLTGDFSHWCTVSESMLDDQQDILGKIIPHVHHIHARIGYEHGPQVNDPFAPEWNQHMETFIGWWNKILEAQSTNGSKSMTITPEFGPVPYMPTLPYSQRPLSDQWQTNVRMRDLLKKHFSLKEASNLIIL